MELIQKVALMKLKCDIKMESIFDDEMIRHSEQPTKIGVDIDLN